jgi:hypothetical protein
MSSSARAAALAIALAVDSGGPAAAQTVPPIQVSALPHIVIFSPEFYWSNAPDVVRMASATCPKGRAIGGGLNILQGNASLRIQDSYPDGSSWVVRFAVRQGQGAAPPEQTLRVRGFALCLLPVSRDFSVPLATYSRLLHQSSRINIAAGGVSTTGRQACPEGALVISGGIGLDPASLAAARLRMELSFPDPLGWNVRAINDAGATEAAAEVRVHGVCIATADGVDISRHRTVSFVEADVTLKPDGSTLRQSVVCKDEQAYALAGGFRLLRGRSATVELHESFPDTPSSWTMALSNRSANTGNAAVRLYAVCLKP